jgi:hypothetical protein
MYVSSKHFKEEPEQEIICLFTEERYVHMEGNDLTLIDPMYHEGAVESLPSRFFKTPFIVRKPNGQVRVFGSID